jgi:hypothetical protein
VSGALSLFSDFNTPGIREPGVRDPGAWSLGDAEGPDVPSRSDPYEQLIWIGVASAELQCPFVADEAST